MIRGHLKNPARISDIIESVFPGGSITGAPKVRAMEIIAEIERVSRGAYCGSLGYSVLMVPATRTFLFEPSRPPKVGCKYRLAEGIVSQSDPVSEYEETIHKAHGMLRSII